MRRRQRQISLKECYDILHLEKGADLQAVKTAYRKRAFELHPDLNPGNAEAGEQFKLLNEAYVALTAMLKPAEEARRRAEAWKAEHGKEERREKAQEEPRQPGPEAKHAYEEQDVLRDLLNDPFARRVYEDIYSELDRKRKSARQDEPPRQEPKPNFERVEQKPPRHEEPVPPLHHPKDDGKGFMGAVKSFFRKQIDEEQTLFMPAAGLGPGRKIRLKVRRGFSDDVSAIEVTLPQDFMVGKPFRLRGLGKRIGQLQGDLYLTINTR